MEPGRVYLELCSHCSAMIPPKEEPSTGRAHHPNLAVLRQSGESCVMCKMMQSTWSLKGVQRRFPEIDEASSDSILLEVRLKGIQSSASGLSWALLEVGFKIPSRAFVFFSAISIETCDSECELIIESLISTLLRICGKPPVLLCHCGKALPRQFKINYRS
jgi:hypothetical protein